MTSQSSLTSTELDSPLWHFALSFWRTPGVEAACLTLQAGGWSVTRILCASWLATLGKTYEGEPYEVRQWRETMTMRLRSMKQALPKDVPALSTLRQQIAASELESERVELALAFTALNPENDALVPSEDVAYTLFQCNLYAAAPNANVIDQETRGLIDLLTTLLVNHATRRTESAL